jgi:hypothetical protein
MWRIFIYINLNNSNLKNFTNMKTFIYSVRNSRFDEPSLLEINAFDEKNALDRALALHQGKRVKIKGLK